MNNDNEQHNFNLQMVPNVAQSPNMGVNNMQYINVSPMQPRLVNLLPDDGQPALQMQAPYQPQIARQINPRNQNLFYVANRQIPFYNPVYVNNFNYPRNITRQVYPRSNTPQNVRPVYVVPPNVPLVPQIYFDAPDMMVPQMPQMSQINSIQPIPQIPQIQPLPISQLPINQFNNMPYMPVNPPKSERSSSQPNSVQNPVNISRPVSDISKPSTIHYHPEPEPETNVELFITPTIRLCNSIPTCDSSPAALILDSAIKNMKSDKQIISNIPDSTFVEIPVFKKSKDYTFNNRQKFVIKESVFESIYQRDHIEIQLKCVDNTNTINNFPKQFCLFLNGISVNSPIKDENLGDESMLIKNKLQKLENSLEITCFVPGDPKLQEDVMCFKFLINLVLRSTMSVMCRALVNKRTQSLLKSIEFIQHYFVQNHLEMVRGYTVVSFYDPVTKNRIMLPVRGENCKHVQCFDFESFCSRHQNRTHFICSICGVVSSIPGVIVDGFMCTVINHLKDINNLVDVKITPECNWSLFSNETQIEKDVKDDLDVNLITKDEFMNIFGEDKKKALVDFFAQANIKSPASNKEMQLTPKKRSFKEQAVEQNQKKGFESIFSNDVWGNAKDLGFSGSSDMPDIFKFTHDDLMENNSFNKLTTWDPIDDDFLKDIDSKTQMDGYHSYPDPFDSNFNSEKA